MIKHSTVEHLANLLPSPIPCSVPCSDPQLPTATGPGVTYKGVLAIVHFTSRRVSLFVWLGGGVSFPGVTRGPCGPEYFCKTGDYDKCCLSIEAAENLLSAHIPGNVNGPEVPRSQRVS